MNSFERTDGNTIVDKSIAIELPEVNKGNSATVSYNGILSNSGAEKVLLGQKWLQEFANELENSLKSYPEQWFNFYPF